MISLAGLTLAAIDLLLWLATRLGRQPARLPGDIVYRTDLFTLYLPMTTCLLASLLLSALLGTGWWLSR